MSAAELLNLLEGVRRTGKDRWLACCPSHSDKHPSLSIRELDDGTVLVRCWSGDCSADEIVRAVGLTLSDLFPARLNGDFRKAQRKPFPASDILTAMAHESMIVWVIGAHLARGDQISEASRGRLMEAVARILAAERAAGGSAYRG